MIYDDCSENKKCGIHTGKSTSMNKKIAKVIKLLRRKQELNCGGNCNKQRKVYREKKQFAINKCLKKCLQLRILVMKREKNLFRLLYVRHIISEGTSHFIIFSKLE